MIILKMRASFGKLHGELDLREGLNILCLPNEAGKSTWSAFLLAMLYGIDTSQRATKANQWLPEKERYKPWDGSPMEGSVDLIWQGRAITIERRTSGRIPMGDFTATETSTGIPIPELTAENCGKILCGVERSVFERTAFIHQLGLSVSESPELEKRLNALVTTGEEGKSASQLEGELHSLKNSLTGRSGKIPRLKEQIQKISQALASLRTLEEDALSVRARLEEAEKNFQRLDSLMKRIENAKAAKKYLAREELRQKNAREELLCKALEEKLAQIPDEEELHRLQHLLEERESAMQTARMEVAFGPAAPQPPSVPACFSGLSAEEARKKAEDDVQKYEDLTKIPAPRKLLPLLLCTLPIAAGIVLCFFSLYAGLITAAAGAAALAAVLIVLGVKSSKQKECWHKAELLLVRWGAENVQDLTDLAEKYAAAQEVYAKAVLRYQEETAALAAAFEQAKEAVQDIISEIRKFAPSCADAAQCKTALAAGLRLHGEYAAEMRILEQQRLQLSSFEELLPEADGPADTEALALDESRVSYERDAVAHLVSDLRSGLSERLGRIQATGDRVRLEAELEQLNAELAQAEETAEVIDLASQVLAGADEALRSRFSPQITGEADKILEALTCGKYSTLQLQPDMHLSVRGTEDTVLRPSAAMSCGTADQMYLALRLAMCRYLLPENAPLVLDDALVNFDSDRSAAALRLLREEGQKRQIILFTCRPL